MAGKGEKVKDIWILVLIVAGIYVGISMVLAYLSAFAVLIEGRENNNKRTNITLADVALAFARIFLTWPLCIWWWVGGKLVCFRHWLFSPVGNKRKR